MHEASCTSNSRAEGWEKAMQDKISAHKLQRHSEMPQVHVG